MDQPNIPLGVSTRGVSAQFPNLALIPSGVCYQPFGMSIAGGTVDPG